MQQENERGMLGNRLDELSVEDVAPGWDRQAAWASLGARLEQPERKRIPVWLYPSLAAALLLFGFFIYSGTERTMERMAATAPVQALPTAITRPAVPEPVQLAPRVAAVRPATAPLRVPVQQATAAVQTRPEAPAAAVPDAPLPPAPDTLQLVARPLKRTFSEPVYSLNEIADEVPEKVADQRVFSGIFHLRPLEDNRSTAPSASSLLRSRSPQQSSFLQQ